MLENGYNDQIWFSIKAFAQKEALKLNLTYYITNDEIVFHNICGRNIIIFRINKNYFKWPFEVKTTKTNDLVTIFICNIKKPLHERTLNVFDVSSNLYPWSIERYEFSMRYYGVIYSHYQHGILISITWIQHISKIYNLATKYLNVTR